MWTGPPVLHAHGKGGENGGDVTCLLRGGGEGGTTETRRERAARERGHGQSHHECSQGWVHSAINLDRHVRAGVRASCGCETACYIREPAFVVDTASIRRPTKTRCCNSLFDTGEEANNGFTTNYRVPLLLRVS